MQQLPEDFWLKQQGLILLSDTGTVYFTRRGRAHYGPLMAQRGFALANVTTVERLLEVLGCIEQGQFEADHREMLHILNDPTTTEEERAIIRQVLKL